MGGVELRGSGQEFEPEKRSIHGAVRGKSAVLPFVTLQATIPVPADEKSTLLQYFAKSDMKSLEQYSGTSALDAGHFAGQSEAWDDYVSERSKTDLGISTLGDNISAPGVAKAFGVKDEAGFAQQKPLFELIHHPYADGDELPRRFQRPIPVIVIDTKLYADHCEFVSAAAIGTSTTCDEMALSFNLLDDHGTHVYGIIAAKINGKGIVGLNPYAATTLREVTLSHAMSNDELESSEAGYHQSGEQR